MNHIIDGKAISQRTKGQVKTQVAALSKAGIQPALAVIIVGDNPASRVYVNNKKKACEQVGILSHEIALPQETSQTQLLEVIAELNTRVDVHGILCQLPLPRQIEEQEILRAILPQKDVDAFHPVNVGHIMIGDHHLLPCTPAGIMKMLEEEEISIAGKHCVVIGRSNIVGKPMAMLLLHANATVTICHSRTQDLAAQARQADILVSAVGIPNFVSADMVKPGAVVIDVGMNRNEAGKLCGDVDFAAVEPIASAITPVPGGVGPMTIAMLMQNTVTAARLQAGK